MTSQAPPFGWRLGTPEQRLAWRRYWLRDTGVGLGDMAMHYAMKLGTIDSCSAAGALLGRALGPAARARARRARMAARRLRPELSDAQLEAFLERMWANVGRTMGEFSVQRRLWRSDRVSVVGRENFEAARAAGRARIYIGLHLGNWELLGPKLLTLGEDLIEFYQPPANRYRRWIADHTRRQFEDLLLPPGPASAQRAFRFLADRKGALVMFVDEFMRGDVQAPTLGRPLNLKGNLANAARFAVLTDALILPIYGLRVGGAHFRMHILEPVDLPAQGNGVDLAANVRALDQLIEPIILANLEQWYMLHELRS
jgi:KDO2-lipid IV(A) lauroyltransferase